MAEGLTIVGLKELQSVLRKIDRKLPNEMSKQLRTTVGTAFVQDVRSRLGWSREIPATIKPRVSGGTLRVVSAPPIRAGRRSPQGFQAIYEFAPRWSSRAFMTPTLREWQSSGKLERELHGFLDWLAEEWRS